MPTTIYDVADRAGVSIATVSRVLNDSPRVSAATREKVMRAVAALGYRPNAAARGLAGQRTGTLALVFPRLSGPFYSQLIRGAEVEAAAAGYHLLIYSVYNSAQGAVPEVDAQTLGMLWSKVDGMILATRAVGADYVADLLAEETPLLLLGEEAGELSVDCVRPDNVAGAVQAVSHLIDHGCRRIALIGGPPDQVHARERETGYRDALRRHNLPVDEALIGTGDFDEAGGYAAMTRLLQAARPPDAVFAANDQMAIGAAAAVRAAGLRVPGDIALVGFDDIETARYLQPPLTTVHQDVGGQGRRAVQLLLARVAEPERPAVLEVVPTHLVVRKSCGCTVAPA